MGTSGEEDRDTNAEPASESNADPEAVAKAICLRQLTAAPRTRAQLSDTLRRRAVPDDAAARVLDRLVEVGLVDDAAFAEAWVRSRHDGRGLARRALAHELRQRGVDEAVAATAVDVLGPADEEVAARALVDRRLTALPTSLSYEARARRLAGLLARKGYPGGLASRVVREALAEAGIRRHTAAHPLDGHDLDA